MTAAALEFRGVLKRFPRFTLGPLDLTAPPGCIYGLIGPNGAGKSTSIDLVMGMGALDGGTISVFGLDHERDEVAVKRRIGYVSPELDYSPWRTVGRLIRFLRPHYPAWDDAYCHSLLKRMRLDTEERITTLSFGGKTKLAVVMALAHRPDMLLLDEPLTGLDAVSKSDLFPELLEAVQDERRTVIISSHSLSDIERFTDHLGILNRGWMVLEGQTSALIERFRMIHGECADSPPLRREDGLYLLRHEGTRFKILADTLKDPIARLQAAGFTGLTDAPVTLEELFVALVKESAS